MATHYVQNNVSKVCTYNYVNMCATEDMIKAATIFSNTNNSVRNEGAIVQFSSGIYCFCVLTEQKRDRRNIKYRQQTETHRQQVMTNHKIKRITPTIILLRKGNLCNHHFP